MTRNVVAVLVAFILYLIFFFIGIPIAEAILDFYGKYFVSERYTGGVHAKGIIQGTIQAAMLLFGCAYASIFVATKIVRWCSILFVCRVYALIFSVIFVFFVLVFLNKKMELETFILIALACVINVAFSLWYGKETKDHIA